ncbi:hypothetical protein ANN_25639 [Periplaneta americana]|uniref:Uncharacterized protein n=1 Tax=Periplaneta americana TaxID=6978 RepID=A0ABQ8S436_PERAM|nr:hypothetical protein ANN_25639 [Periplaneta americana]
MAGLCDGGNEPPGSLKAKLVSPPVAPELGSSTHDDLSGYFNALWSLAGKLLAIAKCINCVGCLVTVLKARCDKRTAVVPIQEPELCVIDSSNPSKWTKSCLAAASSEVDYLYRKLLCKHTVDDNLLQHIALNAEFHASPLSINQGG